MSAEVRKEAEGYSVEEILAAEAAEAEERMRKQIAISLTIGGEVYHQRIPKVTLTDDNYTDLSMIIGDMVKLWVEMHWAKSKLATTDGAAE